MLRIQYGISISAPPCTASHPVGFTRVRNTRGRPISNLDQRSRAAAAASAAEVNLGGTQLPRRFRVIHGGLWIVYSLHLPASLAARLQNSIRGLSCWLISTRLPPRATAFIAES